LEVYLNDLHLKEVAFFEKVWLDVQRAISSKNNHSLFLNKDKNCGE